MKKAVQLLSVLKTDEESWTIRIQGNDCQNIIGAHKTVLASWSPVFNAMFEKNRFAESTTQMLTIPDINFTTLTLMVDFMYVGKLIEADNFGDCVGELYIAAEKYQIEELVDVCVDYIVKSVTVDSASAVLRYADMYSLEPVKHYVLHYMVTNADLRKYPEFKKQVEDLNLSSELLSAFIDASSNPPRKPKLMSVSGIMLG